MRLKYVSLGHPANCSSLGNVLNVLVWSEVVVTTVWVAALAWETRRRRPEGDGGETRTTPEGLVRTGGEGEKDGGPGLVGQPDGADLSRGLPDAPTEAHVQITDACGLPCPACHVDPRRNGKHLDLATIRQRFQALSAEGVLRVALGGGESLLHPELPEILAAARACGLSVGVTTSGTGLDERLVGALLDADQVNVSLDGLGAVFQESRGYDGSNRALAAIGRLRRAGVRVGVNVVLDRNTFEALPETVTAAIEAGAQDVQLLRLKPAGRGTRDYLSRRLTPAQGLRVWPAIKALIEASPEVYFRGDCALVPFLAAHDPDPERIARFAIRGCHGGDTFVSVDLSGAVHPCSFHAGPVDESWRDGVVKAPCGSCPYRAACRGGCHVVSTFLGGSPETPDPECPRVIAATMVAEGAQGDASARP